MIQTFKKICAKCKEEKPLSEYNLAGHKKHNYYRSECKICQKSYRNEWFAKNKEKYLESCRKYGEEHKKEKAEYFRKWKKNNLEKVRKYHRNYCKIKRENDCNFKLKDNLRRRMRWSIRKNSKTSSTISLLGCSMNFLKEYLESKFQHQMSWANYGGNDYSKKHWHVDHIRPCASFDLSKPEQQKKCFHYTNLQPLWAIDNITKSNREIN